RRRLFAALAWARRAALWGGRAVVAAAAASVLWVGAYAFWDPPGTWLIERERARLGAVAHQWTAIDALPAHVPLSMIAAEDANFCAHFGVDWTALRAAIMEWRMGEALRGASTISQQTAINVFLWPDRSFLRKGLELWFTLWIEAFWSKRRILEVYLNVAEFGEGAFGVEAGARAAFARPAAELSRRQAARLAAVLPAPRDRDPAALQGFVPERAASIAAGAGLLVQEARVACLE
ncbi:MAG: monofunctional biosynthetic peptidoglycan transglycosylase, partial [Pseudomonadota bacterium]